MTHPDVSKSKGTEVLCRLETSDDKRSVYVATLVQQRSDLPAALVGYEGSQERGSYRHGAVQGRVLLRLD